jgi:hypothetical protein
VARQPGRAEVDVKTAPAPQLTDRQIELLDTITKLTAERGGVPPTLVEMGAALGCHWTNCANLARKCQKAGRLDYRPRTARSWVVIDPPKARQ